MITDRDREIINFIDNIGFSTINHIAQLFFTASKVGYDLARRRLKKIKDTTTYIKSIKNSETNEIVYLPYDSNKKRITKHDLMVIDYLCNLKRVDCDIEMVELEKQFENVIPDALVSFKFNGYRYYQLLEIELRHDYVDVNKYAKVVDLILKETNDVLPSLIIVQDTKHDYTKDNKTTFPVYQMYTDMSEIAKVLFDNI